MQRTTSPTSSPAAAAFPPSPPFRGERAGVRGPLHSPSARTPAPASPHPIAVRIRPASEGGGGAEDGTPRGRRSWTRSSPVCSIGHFVGNCNQGGHCRDEPQWRPPCAAPAQRAMIPQPKASPWERHVVGMQPVGPRLIPRSPCKSRPVGASASRDSYPSPMGWAEESQAVGPNRNTVSRNHGPMARTAMGPPAALAQRAKIPQPRASPWERHVVGMRPIGPRLIPQSPCKSRPVGQRREGF